MLKTIGVMIILLSGTGIGVSQSLELMVRKRTLREVLQMVILLKGEIHYECASLFDSFTGIAGKVDRELQEFVLDVAACLKIKDGQSFGEHFYEKASDFFGKKGLSREELECICSVGKRLGYLDVQMQVRQLSLCEEELSGYLARLSEEFADKKRLCLSVGILGGIFLAVVFW